VYYYLFNIIILDTFKRSTIDWFQRFIGDVNGRKYRYRIIMGMPGGASLYSLSVAWVSSFGALAPKRGLCVVARLCSVCCQAMIKLL